MHVRYTIPTRYDIAPFGTMCVVIGETEEQRFYYIQLSTNELIAAWEPINDFLGYVFQDEITDQNFIDECLHIYKQKANIKD